MRPSFPLMRAFTPASSSSRTRILNDAVPVAAAGVALRDEAARVVGEFVEELVREGGGKGEGPSVVGAAVGADEAVEEGWGPGMVVVCVRGVGG